LTWHLKMEEAEADVITSAVEAASNQIGSENKITALEHICQSWLQENVESDPPSIDSLINYAAKVFNVTLAEVSLSGGEPEEQIQEQEEEIAPPEDNELDGLTTKKALREYIKEHGLKVKIARGHTIDTIKENIREELATEPAETEVSGNNVDIDDIIGDTTPVADEENGEENKKSSEPETEDINAILGIE